MSTIESVKTVLGIKDSLQSDVLTVLISNVESRLKVWLKQHAELDSIPTELNFIVEELTVQRYNRMGAEGAKSESVEGRSMTFQEDDFKPYLSILETYIPVQAEKTGKVVFF